MKEKPKKSGIGKHTKFLGFFYALYVNGSLAIYMRTHKGALKVAEKFFKGCNVHVIPTEVHEFVEKV